MNRAGQKVLWTIDFQPMYTHSHKPEITFIAKKQQMARHLPSGPFEIPSKNKAQDFLNRIQAMCNKITEDCKKEAFTEEDYLKKSHLVSKELGDLDELIKKLNDILKWFKPPETGEKPGF
jgi:hypothetical protein